MERSRLRYVNAVDLGDQTMDFGEIDVESAEGKPLGQVHGFLLEITSNRPYYVVVDAGGWFSSKYFLVPIGHARLDTERNMLATDLAQERVSAYPGFDLDEFEKLSDEALRRIDVAMLAACCPDDKADRLSDLHANAAHYRQPDWWKAEYYRQPTAPSGTRRD